MKKILKSIFIIITVFILIVPSSFASDDVDFKDLIKKEDGSLFERIIAECIGGISQTVFDFVTKKEFNVGFKNYDDLIFNDNAENDSLSPFTEDLWNKTMDWYRVFAIISGSLILIAVFILSYKIISAGMNTGRKNDAKESLMRLCFGGVAIALAPLFIRLLLFLNNSLVHLLITTSHGSLDDLLGNSVLKSIRTGSAITTAIVIAMFIYLFLKLNIKFIVRQFTIIIFTIFTPIACGLWIINKNVTAASIWTGQIIMNIFMQFIYCFLFLIYLAFLPSSGWLVSLIWAMMILPLADALQNCLQNLTSRIAGIDSEQITNRALGLGTMFGFGVVAIKEQFKSASANNRNNNSNNNSNNGLKGFIDKAKSVINPPMNLTDETDYNGNINPIRNVKPKQKTSYNNSNHTSNRNTNKKTSNNNDNNKESKVVSFVKTGVNATKDYLNMGANMTEGDFSSWNYKNTRKNNFQNTEYTNNTRKSGDNDENK